MIANISHTEQVKPLIEYNERKVEKGEAERIFYTGFDEKADKNTVISHFALHTRDSKRKDKNMHISLNFPIEDNSKLSNEFLKEISFDYLKRLGFPENHPYIIYRHFDAFQQHVHIVCPKIIEGKKVLQDSNLYLRSQKITRELELKFDLVQVNNIKKSIKKVPEEIFIKDKIEDTLDKRKKFSYAVDYIINNYHPVTLNEFNEQLKLVGLEVITNNYVDKENTEKIGFKYKIAGSNDLPINSSTLYSNPGHKKLEKLFKNNKKYRLKREDEIKDFIHNRIFNRYHKITFEQFSKELEKIDLEINYTYKNGVVAAYRIFDKRENLYYKPSGIDRSLSFGNIKDKFSTKIERNYKYHNATLLYVLDKKYKELYPNSSKENNAQHYVMFMARNGMIPDVYNGKLRFNNYLNKNPLESDYTANVPIALKNLDFNEISNLVHSKNYRSQVWLYQKELTNDQNEKIPEKALSESLLKGVDKIIDLFEIKQKNKVPGKTKKQNL